VTTAPRTAVAVLLATAVLAVSSSPALARVADTATVSPSASVEASGLPSVALPLPGAVEPPAPVEIFPAVSADGAAPTQAGLAKVLGPLLARPALGRSVSAEVVDVVTGTVVYSKDAARAVVPASSVKILTTAAALAALGPDTTLPTRAVAGVHAGEVVLVGGGDVLLAPGAGDPDATTGHAGLADLADATVAALRASGTAAVTVRLDDTLFHGPATNPAWSPDDVRGGHVAPVMAVEVTAGVTRPQAPPKPGFPSPRLRDPAMSAARQFAALLKARGMTVSGSVARVKAPPESTVLGEVSSASVADIAEFVLTNSDNTAAEALAKLVAIAGGRQATFSDGGRAVLDKVAKLGVSTTGAQMLGGSGLGHGTLIPAHTIAGTLALAGSPEQARLRAVLTGLPVAGASGTLATRFAAATQARGVGVVRAKTGTLTGASSLAGTVVDAEGRLLAFAVIADAVPSTLPGRTALDTVGAALSGCGCH
jgi:D-alanyl-D-alanine carboxypeptidase/D-alanyl-D-alanine-endopeptidase (penicillin-binding protein 4)